MPPAAESVRSQWLKVVVGLILILGFGIYLTQWFLQTVGM